MAVCALIKPHAVCTRSSAPSFIVMIQTEIGNHARLCICIEISERLRCRIEAGLCLLVSVTRISGSLLTTYLAVHCFQKILGMGRLDPIHSSPSYHHPVVFQVS
jgi:hypothetical protein